jgi:hypothetical protein
LLLAGALLTTLLLAALLLLARFLVGILVHYGVFSNGWFEVFFLTPRPNALDNAPPRHSFRVSGAAKAVGTDSDGNHCADRCYSVSLSCLQSTQ